MLKYRKKKIKQKDRTSFWRVLTRCRKHRQDLVKTAEREIILRTMVAQHREDKLIEFFNAFFGQIRKKLAPDELFKTPLAVVLFFLDGPHRQPKTHRAPD